MKRRKRVPTGIFVHHHSRRPQRYGGCANLMFPGFRSKNNKQLSRIRETSHFKGDKRAVASFMSVSLDMPFGWRPNPIEHDIKRKQDPCTANIYPFWLTACNVWESVRNLNQVSTFPMDDSLPSRESLMLTISISSGSASDCTSNVSSYLSIIETGSLVGGDSSTNHWTWACENNKVYKDVRSSGLLLSKYNCLNKTSNCIWQ